MRRRIGNGGMEVNAIGLGGMPLSIQGRPDERTALAVIGSFVAGGGDFIDTAISYCFDEADFGAFGFPEDEALADFFVDGEEAELGA